MAIQLDVKRGMIENCELSGSYFSLDETKRISKDLIGRRHFYEDIRQALRTDSTEVISSFF